jgi:hypothetical protein
MDTDHLEELQRSIDALLARIEVQKLMLGSLLRGGGPIILAIPAGSTVEGTIATAPPAARNVR